MEHEDEYREEDNRLRYERQQVKARQAFIYRDPFYPPQWAAEEWGEKKRSDEA